MPYSATDNRIGDPHTAVASDELAVGLAHFKCPWVTFALLAIMIGVFALENLFFVTPGVGLTPSAATLFALGGLTRQAAFAGREWFRLFTAPLLHVSPAHLLGNSVALLLGGWLLERLIGRLWFSALFFIAALGGSLMSLAIAPPNIVSVGASGAVVGMFAALFVLSFHMPTGTTARIRLQVSSLGVLIPSLVPLFSASADQMDYGAHFGGALSGVAVAGLLLLSWPQTEPTPPFRKAAAAISVIGTILFVVSAGIVVARYPQYLIGTQKLQPGGSVEGSVSEGSSDHGTGRVACDAQWSDLVRNNAIRPDTGYPDFIRTCMKNVVQ